MLTAENCPPLNRDDFDAYRPSWIERLPNYLSWGCLLLSLASLAAWWFFGFPLLVVVGITPFVASLLGGRITRLRTMPIRERLEIQLAERPETTATAWGEDPYFRVYAARCCHLAQQTMGWKSDRFVPWDPFDMVFFSPDNNLASVEFVTTLQKEGSFEISDEILASYFSRTFGQVVVQLYELTYPVGPVN